MKQPWRFWGAVSVGVLGFELARHAGFPLWSGWFVPMTAGADAGDIGGLCFFATWFILKSFEPRA